MYYSFNIRIIIGLIMIVSPLAGFLYIDYNSDLSLMVLCGTLAGIPFAVRCCEKINFRLCTSFAAGFFVLAVLCRSLATARIIIWSCSFFMGLCMPMLAVVLPANIIIGCFRRYKIQVLTFTWSFSLFSAVCLKIIAERFTYPLNTVISGCIIMLAGILLVIETSWVHVPSGLLHKGHACHMSPCRSKGSFKIFVFFALISFALGLCFFKAPGDLVFDFFLTPESLFAAVLWAAPAAAALISCFRGIYSGCIWVLFLAEIAIASGAHAENMAAAVFAEALAGGLCLGSLPVIIPIITYYVCGPEGYISYLCRITASVPAGFTAAFLLAPAASSRLSGLWSACGVMILLIFAFFTIFSAWKHRLYILKNGKI